MSQAAAALDALAGPNQFGLTQPQIESFRERLAGIYGEDKTHRIEFEEKYGGYGTHCCEERMLTVKGFQQAIEHFKEPKGHTFRHYVCKHCGKIGDKV